MTASSDRKVLRELAGRCQAALQILLEAYTNAQQLRVDVWTFAVEIKYLREAGLADHDLRFLFLGGYIDHAAETTARGRSQRTFRKTGPHTLTAKTCVVLTESGAAWVRQWHKARRRRQTTRATTPTFDSEDHEWRVGSLVLKHFGQPAPSQEWLLIAFEQQNWQRCIAVPPLPETAIRRKRYLHNTIQNLNRHQRVPLIRFYRDGSGRRVCWEWRG